MSGCDDEEVGNSVNSELDQSGRGACNFESFSPCGGTWDGSRQALGGRSGVLLQLQA